MYINIHPYSTLSTVLLHQHMIDTPHMPSFYVIEFKLDSKLFAMSYLSFKSYQSPATIDSFDVGICYKSDCDEDRLCLNNNLIEVSEILLPLDNHGKCVYKIYFKKNTPRLCEVKIFISNRAIDKS